MKIRKIFLIIVCIFSFSGIVNAETCTDNCVASIGNEKYSTIMDAIGAVESNNESMVTIKVLRDSTAEAGLYLVKSDAKNITIDFDNHNVVFTSPVGSPGTISQAMHFEQDNKVVLKNGTINFSNQGNIKMGIQNYGNLTLENVVVDASEVSYIKYVISNNAGSLYVLGNSSIKAASNMIAFDEYWWPSNSYINGPDVIIDTKGTIDGKIELSKDSSNSGNKPSTLTIKNGNFTGTIDKQYDSAEITISGGTFSNQIATNYLEEGNILLSLGGKYYVKPAVCTEDCVAAIGDKKYYTIMQAINDVEANNESMVTINVLKNSTEEPGLYLVHNDSKKITINFNGYKVIFTNPVGSYGTVTQAMHFEKGNEIVLTNGTIELPNQENIKMGIQNYGDLTLNNLVLDGSKASYVQYVVSNNAGSLKVLGSSSIFATSEQIAFDEYWWPNGSYKEGPSVTIDTTGTINGKIELTWDKSNNGTKESSLTIKNGYFTGTIDKQDKNAKISISGGTFDVNPDIEYLVTNYTTEINDSKYVVVENKKIETTLEDNEVVSFESEDAFSHNYVLVVTKKSEDSINNLESSIINSFSNQSDVELISLYDISVIDNNSNIIEMNNGLFTISIPISEDLQIYDNYKVIYVDDNGNIAEKLDAKLIDGKIVFVTTHLSTYGIVGYNNVKNEIVANPKTSDSINTYIAFSILSLISLVVLALSLTKKRSIN